MRLRVFGEIQLPVKIFYRASRDTIPEPRVR